jgi:hypothetical protein
MKFLSTLVLQIMNSLCQLSERARPNRIFSLLEVSYRALGQSGLAKQPLHGKFFCCRPDFFQMF